MKRTTKQQGNVRLVFLTAVLTCCLGCHVSPNPITPGSAASPYVRELLSAMRDNTRRITDDGWNLVVAESEYLIWLGEHRVRLEREGDVRALFRIWEADPGSGSSFTTWVAADSAAILVWGSYSLDDGTGRVRHDSGLVYLLDRDEIWELQKYTGSIEDAISRVSDPALEVAVPAVKYLGGHARTSSAVGPLLALWRGTDPLLRYRASCALSDITGRLSHTDSELARQVAEEIVFSDAASHVRTHTLRTYLHQAGALDLARLAANLDQENDLDFLRQLDRRLDFVNQEGADLLQQRVRALTERLAQETPRRR